jgi:LPS-assembly protein
MIITLLALCHLQIQGQALTNAAPPAAQVAGQAVAPPGVEPAASTLPDDPGQEILPVAQPEPELAGGVPVEFEARKQSRVGDIWTLTGDVVVHYRDYILRADKAVYHQSTTILEAEGNLQVAGGPNDVLIFAQRGEMRLNTHTARFYNVHGSQGVRALSHSTIFSTANPFFFTARVLLETSKDNYRLIDGTMTNCRLPKPDWQVYSRSIKLENNTASTANALFKFLGLPIFYLPYLRHPVDDTGRESGFLIPVISTGSSIKGYTLGEQVYWAINRNMDMIAGAEFYSKRGWAPNGDFRYRGPGLDHLNVRWNALLDRGVELPSAADPTQMLLTNQGGVDVIAQGRKDLSPETRIAGNVEYLSRYIYRLVFNDNFTQAVSSEVQSDLSLTHARNGYIASVSMARFQSFASAANGDEVKILHLPNLRFDVLDRPLGVAQLYWGMGSSLGYLNRSEPQFHARNAVRDDLYPHLTLPLSAGGWNLVAEAALRETAYSLSQTPNLTTNGNGTPAINHDALNRSDFEASVDLRPPAVERDFTINHWNRELRHVIEPEIGYRSVTGIGAQAQNVLLIDTTDITTNTNELGLSLTQRLYLRPIQARPCAPDKAPSTSNCAPQAPREWASWQIAQKFFLDPHFGGALISGRRNVFDTTLDMSGVAFLTAPRNIAPVTSRMRFEAIDNLRIQWDMDYDPLLGRFGADNLYAGYSRGRTTVGMGHALLNAVDENGSAASTIKSQQIQPFFSIGKPSGNGLNIAANAGYDYTYDSLIYAGAQAVYNWNCCGLSVGYRRFELGSVRNETQYLYSFTIANFGSVGDIRRSNSVFRDPTLPPAY